ncbi:hypothetical protein DSM112329_05434 [Paraconexibacter sp. AEG42_29]|uniref:Uncharacterized protein n=1 Tax=Paraconexibacter sp. AEG42_29 TaxID=2997339 RepID=A0AAU7B3C9_9ACTN
MSRQRDHSHSVRKVVLPSGKTIEIVSFEDQLVDGLTRPAKHVAHELETEEALHHCGSCASDLVYPLDWSEAGARHWEVTLRCPNCEWIGTGVFASEAVERFDAELDRGTESVISDLRRMIQANMEDDIERFAAALHAGFVLPEDF